MKINVKKIKVGEEYFFPNTIFERFDDFRTFVRKERINKIIGNNFSTKNSGWDYEIERFIGFTTEEEARKYLIKRIKERKKYLIQKIYEEYERELNKLTISNS